jgi:hypothetical protein
VRGATRVPARGSCDRSNRERALERAPDPEPVRGPPTALPSQLFDLEAGPLEQVDLAAQEPARAARMERRLASWFEEVERDRRSAAD